MLIKSEHKQINGNIEGNPFDVAFDSNGRAEVDDEIGEFLIQLNSAKKIPVLTEMNVRELREEAARLGVDLGGARSKEEILSKITGSQQPPVILSDPGAAAPASEGGGK